MALLKKNQCIMTNYLDKENKKPKTNLLMGQRFLVSARVLNKIIDSANLSPTDTILEIGPGAGALTKELIKKAGKVVAVEKDPRLVKFLKADIREAGNLDIIEGDILSEKTLKNESLNKILKSDYKIVANLPYYITSRFLRIFLSPKSFKSPKVILIMVQREIAERIICKNKKNKTSILSLSVCVYGSPKIIANIKPSAFHKPPKVDSSLLLITNISDNFFTKSGIDADKFFGMLKKAFGMKRKKLSNSLFRASAGKNGNKTDLLEKYADKRPEDLSLLDWKEIYYSILSR